MRVGNHFVCGKCGKVFGWVDVEGVCHVREGLCRCSSAEVWRLRVGGGGFGVGSRKFGREALLCDDRLRSERRSKLLSLAGLVGGLWFLELGGCPCKCLGCGSECEPGFAAVLAGSIAEWGSLAFLCYDCGLELMGLWRSLVVWEGYPQSKLDGGPEQK